MIVIGLMSGTSVDRLDMAVADLRLRGDTVTLRPVGHAERPWPTQLRQRLLRLLPPATTTAAEVCELDTLIGQTLAAAAQAAAVTEVAGGRADLIASHGQTVYHWIDQGQTKGTLLLGQPAWIVQATELPVISDFRARDIAAGGQGAPLASTLDALWLAGSDTDPGPRAALNLGGIANITVVGRPGEPVTAFDTGPANCLLDVTASRLTAGEQGSDLDGRLAAAGTVHADLLRRLLDGEYYRLPPPKSTGRELFSAGYLQQALHGLPDIAGPDLMATLTELTATTVAEACARVDVVEVVASGSGACNPTLLAALRRRLRQPPCPPAPTEDCPPTRKRPTSSRCSAGSAGLRFPASPPAPSDPTSPGCWGDSALATDRYAYQTQTQPRRHALWC